MNKIKGFLILMAVVFTMAVIDARPADAQGSCSIFRSWTTGNSLTAPDLTTSFTTVGQTNMVPTCMQSDETSVGVMQATQDPWPAGTEALAGDMKGEVERIRFVLQNLTGWAQWYKNNSIAATVSGSALSQAYTWNNAAVTFPGAWKLTVTDTASNAASLLLDIVKGTNSQMTLDKLGNLKLALGSAGGATIATLTSSPITAARTYTFPDITGIVALTNGGQTFTSGVWNGSIIGTVFGGTGLDTHTAANGTLLIGNGSGWAAPTTLTAGTGITVTNGAGTITLVATPDSTYGIRNLVGVNNAVTPNTKYDMSADLVLLRNLSLGTTVVRTNTGTITNDNTSAQAANGRDQAGAFAVSTWIHFYFIWNGSTLATLSSTVAPPTGPTLPGGYTHWAYAGAVFNSAGGTYVKTKMRGAWMTYLLNQSILSGGTGATYTSVSISAFVPPNSLMNKITFQVNNTNTGSTGGVSISADGTNQYSAVTAGSAPSGGAADAQSEINIPQTSQTVWYGVGAGISASAWVMGYSVPNGGE